MEFRRVNQSSDKEKYQKDNIEPDLHLFADYPRIRIYYHHKL